MSPEEKTSKSLLARVYRAEQVIRRGEAYTLASFKERTGLGPASVRAMERAGLKTRPIGRTKQILGDDYLNFLASYEDVEQLA